MTAEPRTHAGRDLLGWRGQHGKWTEARWIEAIVAIEQEAARTADPGGLRERLTDALRRWYPDSPHHPEAVASAIIAGGLLTPEATAPWADALPSEFVTGAPEATAPDPDR